MQYLIFIFLYAIKNNEVFLCTKFQFGFHSGFNSGFKVIAIKPCAVLPW